MFTAYGPLNFAPVSLDASPLMPSPDLLAWVTLSEAVLKKDLSAALDSSEKVNAALGGGTFVEK